jgi:hypothetical protein
LLHLRALHEVAQLGLTHEEALQERLVAALEVREHAQLLDRARREILRLVDDQQRTLALGRDLAEERLERREDRRLVEPSTGTPNAIATARSRSSASSWVLTSCAAMTLRWIELLEQATDDCRLARADFARDDDEASLWYRPYSR